MSIDEVKDFIYQRAISIVSYCCNNEECDEARILEFELIEEISDEWINKLREIELEINNRRLRIAFRGLIEIGSYIMENDGFIPIENSESLYEYEVVSEVFDFSSYWSGVIHKSVGQYCAYINFTKQSKLYEDFVNNDNPDLFLFFWIVSVNPDMYVNGKKYIVTNAQKGAEKFKVEELQAIIKLELIMSGRPIKSICEYNKLFLGDSINRSYDCFEGYAISSVPYVQIDGLCDVLSDYHSSTGILDKYLRLYHVYEELMARKAVVVFSKSPEISVRRLTEFHDIKMNGEQNALTELIRLMLTEPSGGNQIEELLFNEIKHIWEQASEDTKTYLNDWYILNNSKDSPAKSFQDIVRGGRKCASALGTYWGYIVYQMRCRIVHNKVTEKHLTYQTLDANNEEALSNVLIPLLELLCIRTLVTIPDYLRYDSKKLEIMLY